MQRVPRGGGVILSRGTMPVPEDLGEIAVLTCGDAEPSRGEDVCVQGSQATGGDYQRIYQTASGAEDVVAKVLAEESGLCLWWREEEAETGGRNKPQQ